MVGLTPHMWQDTCQPYHTIWTCMHQSLLLWHTRALELIWVWWLGVESNLTSAHMAATQGSSSSFRSPQGHKCRAHRDNICMCVVEGIPQLWGPREPLHPHCLTPPIWEPPWGLPSSFAAACQHKVSVCLCFNKTCFHWGIPSVGLPCQLVSWHSAPFWAVHVL